MGPALETLCSFSYVLSEVRVEFAETSLFNRNRSRYASFFGEATYTVVLDGVGLSWDKFRIQLAPCGTYPVFVVASAAFAYPSILVYPPVRMLSAAYPWSRLCTLVYSYPRRARVRQHDRGRLSAPRG